jgi:hypothetical protein
VRDVSIRTKLTVVILVLFVAGSVSVVVVLNQMYAATIDAVAGQALDDARSTFVGLEAAEVAKLGAALDVIRTKDDLRELFLAGERRALYDAALPLFTELERDYDITHWYFEMPPPDSTVFVRVHNQEKFGDSLTERHVYQQAVESGEVGLGKELGQTAFALRVVKPYYAQDGSTVIGYIELGQEIDHFLVEMKEQTSADFAMIVRKELLDRESWASVREVKGLEDNWDDHPTNLLVDSTIDSDLLNEYVGDPRDIPPGGEVLERIEEGGRTFVRAVFPVLDSTGEQVGGVIVLQDVTHLTKSMRDVRVTLLVIGAILGTGMVIVMLFIVNKLVFERLDRMVTILESASIRVAGGDFSVGETVEPMSNDEMGRFEEFFGRFLTVVGGALKELSRRS